MRDEKLNCTVQKCKNTDVKDLLMFIGLKNLRIIHYQVHSHHHNLKRRRVLVSACVDYLCFSHLSRVRWLDKLRMAQVNITYPLF